MIEVSEGFKQAVLNGTVHNSLHITVFGYNSDGSNLHIYNKNIVSESMVIEQAISDDVEKLNIIYNANDGSTAYCVDTGDLYIMHMGEWKKAVGGSGE